jgi:hypothetical protein
LSAADQEENMTVMVELTFEQIAEAVRKMKPGERETLALLLDAPTRRKITARRKMLEREHKQHQLLSERDLFAK